MATILATASSSFLMMSAGVPAGASKPIHSDTFKSTPEDATKLTHIGLAPKATLDPIEHAAWTQLARVLLNTQETITRY
jgi:hypothetical protein